MDPFETLLKKLDSLPEASAAETNFFSVGGGGYLENPTSDLMSLFMGGQTGVPSWLAKALLTCLVERAGTEPISLNAIDWTLVRAEREVSQYDEDNSRKRLDLVVSDGDFVLGIENKVTANAHDNPFDVYDALIQARSSGGPVLKCVVRPHGGCKDVPDGWPVISYGELVAKALALFGEDVAGHPATKWQFFYREFLMHLKSLANPFEKTTMDKDSFQLALENFHHLKHAVKLLDQFEAELQREGQARIREALIEAGVDADIVLRTSNWDGGERALRFYPSNWGEDSQVVLTYMQDLSYSKEGTVGFYVSGYVRLGTEKQNLQSAERKFNAETREGLHPWSFEQGERTTWYEGKSVRYFGMSGWPTPYSKDGAMIALAKLAVWMQKNIFE